MLQLVLAALIEFDHHEADVLRVALVTHLLKHVLVNLVCHHGEGFRLGRRRDLLQKVVTEGVLDSRVFQENCVGPHVEHSVVSLD